MGALVSRRKFELLSLGLAALFLALHWNTAAPIAGLSTSTQGSLVHRSVESLEGRVTDLLFRARGARPADPRVVLVELDERGAQRWGLWPWSRSVLAQILERLLAADAKVIGLDVALTDAVAEDVSAAEALVALGKEGSLSVGLGELQRALERRLAASPNVRLEQVLRQGGVRVVQGVVPFNAREAAGISPAVLDRYREAITPQLITRAPGTVKGSYRELDVGRLPVFRLEGVQTPQPRFAAVGSLYGHFSTVTDVDGTTRRAAGLAAIANPPGLVPSLGLRVAASWLDATIEPVVTDGEELSGIDLRQAGGARTRVPLQDEVAFTLLNYPGPKTAFRRLSSVDVYDGTFDAAAVAGKAVLVGVSITGSAGDQRVTPFEELTEGLVTHATLVSNILSGDFLDRPDFMRPLELALMALMGLGLGLVVPRVPFAWKSVLVVGAVAGWTTLTVALFDRGLRLAWVVPTVDLLTTSFALIFLGYLLVDREKARVRTTFSRYLGEEVIDAALEDPERLNRGEKREMTVLFSDIRGFTSLAERMAPEALASFINGYLSPMTRIVFDEKGTLDKYIGDALMAFWNAPVDQPDHALRACRAAVKMLEKLDELKAGWRAAHFPELEIGVGLNTGPMVVGNMGSDVRVDYTVLGDAVNLGSRLEGTTKQYDVRIVLAESTYEAVKPHVVARRLGAVRVKGRREPVRIYELRALGEPTERDRAIIGTFEAGLDAWAQRRFEVAREAFEATVAAWPADPPSALYLRALGEFSRAPPPPDWDGVITLTSK